MLYAQLTRDLFAIAKFLVTFRRTVVKLLFRVRVNVVITVSMPLFAIAPLKLCVLFLLRTFGH